MGMAFFRRGARKIADEQREEEEQGAEEQQDPDAGEREDSDVGEQRPAKDLEGPPEPPKARDGADTGEAWSEVGKDEEEAATDDS